jgi:hypothetical protein
MTMSRLIKLLKLPNEPQVRELAACSSLRAACGLPMVSLATSKALIRNFLHLQTPGMRAMVESDVPAVTNLLNEYLADGQAKFHPIFDEEEVHRTLTSNLYIHSGA